MTPEAIAWTHLVAGALCDKLAFLALWFLVIIYCWQSLKGEPYEFGIGRLSGSSNSDSTRVLCFTEGLSV